MGVNNWNHQTLVSRIDIAGGRRRYAGGSPDTVELAAYAAALPPRSETGRVLVLGMTPELRQLAARRAESVVTVDANPEAVTLYRDWLEPEERARERILCTDWFEMPAALAPELPFRAVLGDGIFGNLPDLDAHRRLLEIIAATLQPDGRFVTRMALAATGSDQTRHGADALISRYRKGEIDSAEFGFGMRLTGFLHECYTTESFQLDNAAIFQRCAQLHARGILSADEHSAIRRYYFGGTNCIVPRNVWEETLAECGFAYRIHSLQGKLWYHYYPVYECWLAR